MAAWTSETVCRDILEFQDHIKRMRTLDDKIIYALNTSLPTDSFKGKVDGTAACKDLYQQLQQNYSDRERSIKGCINILTNDVRRLKEERLAQSDDPESHRQVRHEQLVLRVLRTELSVEEVIKERTLKVFHERCRDFYKPTDS